MKAPFSTTCCSQYYIGSKNHPACSLRVFHGAALLCGLFLFGACAAAQSGASSSPSAATAAATVQPEEANMWMIIGEHRFAITMADTEAAREFAAMLPLTINMSDLNDNEKHAQLPRALPSNASRPKMIRNGDLMLYGSSTLVVFYLSFNSSYSYTRLGHVGDPDGLAQALGPGDANITFSKN